MTPDEVKRLNLIKLGFQCDKCEKIYDLDHPVDSTSYWARTATPPPPITDTCNNFGDGKYYSFIYNRSAAHYNYFKLRGKWYNVRGNLVDMFLKLDVVEDAMNGHIQFPSPIRITRQVDIFTVAEKLSIAPPLSNYQKKRAQTKAFIERIKK